MLNSGSIGTISNSKFINLSSEGALSALVTTSSQCTVTNSDFQNIHSQGNGSAILALSSSEVTIQESNFRSITSSRYGGVIYSQDSDLILDIVSAIDFKNSAVHGDSLYSLSISNSEFINGSNNEEGGAIYCIECKNVAISNSKFQNNTAKYNGGAICLHGNEANMDQNSAYITRSNFTDNRSNQGGGAIYLSNIRSTIRDCNFERNKAAAEGGAVSLVCPGTKTCEYTIKSSEFRNNSAEIQGGAISWDDKEPTLEVLQFDNNTSVYGNDIASYPIMMQVYLNNETIPYQRRLEDSQYSPIAYRLTNVPPGQTIPKIIKIAVVDGYGNIDYSDNQSTAEISETNIYDTVISGNKRALAASGLYIFDDLSIQYEPGGITYLKVVSNAIDVDKQDSSGDDNTYYDTIYVEFSFRFCEIGETNLGKECKICQYGTYSLDPSKPCANCPSEATCLGNYTMFPKKGYWRTDKFTDTFYECPNTNACLGSDDMTSYTGECAEGYIGNLCQPCDSGYSRTTENQCSPCPEKTANAIRLVGMIILIVVICVIMVQTTFKSAYKPSSLQSIYIKILTNYLQLVMITTQFNLEWPKAVLELFSIQKQSGSMTDQIFSLDCYLSGESSDSYKEVHFQKVIVYALAPVILWLFSLAFWSIMAYKMNSREYFRKEMIATNVILFFLIHPNITRASFAIFSCMEIEGEGYFLIDNLDIECWTGRHYLYSMSLALPSIVIWVLGTPAAVLYYMQKNKQSLLEIDNKLRFGFLYNGYRKKTYYWEFLILYRKILIICAAVFLSNISTGIQALSGLLLLISALYIQMKIRPFTHEILNVMEARGILAATITIYCGLFYLTSSINEPSKYFFFIVIVSVNLFFLSYWVYHFTHEGWKILKRSIGFLRSRYDKEDGYSDFLTEDSLAKKVRIDEGKVKCTLLNPTPSTESIRVIPNDLTNLYKASMSNRIALHNMPALYGNRSKSGTRNLSLALTDRSLAINELPTIDYALRSSRIDSDYSDEDEEYKIDS